MSKKNIYPPGPLIEGMTIPQRMEILNSINFYKNKAIENARAINNNRGKLPHNK